MKKDNIRAIAAIVVMALLPFSERYLSVQFVCSNTCVASHCMAVTGHTRHRSGKVTMIDLGATECIPCKMMAPIIEELKKEYAGKADIIFIDVWKNPGSGEKIRHPGHTDADFL